jgi:hypothetical protein
VILREPDDRATHNDWRIPFADLMLSFSDGEFVSICHQPVGGAFTSSVVKAIDACAQVQSLPERSCIWFSINAIDGPERHLQGRGRERDVTRWAALYLDIDIKPGAFESQEKAWEFIDAMSNMIGTGPTVVIYSGHGLQPLWLISDGKLTDENGDFDEVAWSRAYRLTRRFDRLARKVALESFGAKLDKVADLSRILRVPDTTNWKNPDEPVVTYAVLGTGGPLADMDAVEEFLDQWSAVEVESDHPVGGVVLCNPEGWQFGKRNCPYVITMVTSWNQESDRPKAGRHQWAMNRAVRLACAHRLGCVTEEGLLTSLEYLEGALAHWCQVVGDPRPLHPNEIQDAYDWSVAKVSTFDDRQTRNQLGDHKHQHNTVPPAGGDHPFWTETEILRHILAFARSRGASPYATLVAVLRRTVGCIEPWVVLPATIGGQVSLNLFTSVVGVSGGGKDIANAAGRDAVRFTGQGIAIPAIQEANYTHPGTGEGLARILGADNRAHLQVPDVATLEALADRKGQTLVSQLLAAWAGQPIGFSNNSRATSTALGAHSYRLSLSVGVQPENAAFFLDRQKDGFPQRFLWVPAADPGILPRRPDPMDSISVPLPHFEREPDQERFVMVIPDEVAEEIWGHHYRAMRGDPDIDPLDKHTKLTRLKAAAALDILHNRTEVTNGGWAMAGHLMEKSAQVRDELREAVATKRRTENAAKAHAQADRQEILAERLTEHLQKRVWRAVVRKLKRDERANRLDLYKACDSSIRDDFDPVFSLMVEEKVVVCREGSDEYELAPE